MLAIKESVTVKNHQVVLNLPDGFAANEEVEVIVLSKVLMKPVGIAGVMMSWRTSAQ